MADPSTLLVIIGGSASGKSTLVQTLFDLGLIDVVPTWTTRPERPEEAGGSLEHVFVSDDAFDRLEQEGFFLGTATMFGLPYRYGFPRLAPRPQASNASAPRVRAVVLRASLLDRLAEHVPDHVVYQIEDTVERSTDRLVTRGLSEDECIARLAEREAELEKGRARAHRVFVNDRTVNDLIHAVVDAVHVDFNLARENSIDPRLVSERRRAAAVAPWLIVEPPAGWPPRAHHTWRRVAIGIAVGVFLTGAFVVAALAMLAASLGNWGNNK